MFRRCNQQQRRLTKHHECNNRCKLKCKLKALYRISWQGTPVCHAKWFICTFDSNLAGGSHLVITWLCVDLHLEILQFWDFCTSSCPCLSYDLKLLLYFWLSPWFHGSKRIKTCLLSMVGIWTMVSVFLYFLSVWWSTVTISTHITHLFLPLKEYCRGVMNYKYVWDRYFQFSVQNFGLEMCHEYERVSFGTIFFQGCDTSE